MGAIRLENFQGWVPKLAKTMLTNQQAQIADNVRLYGGELLPWRKPLFVYKPANVNPVVTIYHVVHTTGDERWLTFEADTNVVEGPIPAPDEDRLFWTQAGGTPQKSDWATLSTGPGPYPAASFPMGIPNPNTAPTLVVNGSGTGTAITRAYLYTWVNMFGNVAEESGPSNASTCNWLAGQTITVSGWQAPPTTPAGAYNWSKIRIYRSVVGNDPTQVYYYLVAEIPYTQTSFLDNISDALIPGDPLSTVDFAPPPTNLQGLCMMPNGILAGFANNNEVWFCEPYKPHAWPASYMQPLGYSIVGMAVYEQNLVVMTDNVPYIFTGINPAQMTVTRINLREPCVTKRSIASDMSGAIYASPNGLVGISSLIQGIVSSGLIRRQEWDNFNPTDMTSVVFNGAYFGFYDDTIGDSASGGWALALDKSDAPTLYASMRTDVSSYANAPPLTRMDYHASAVLVDKVTAAMYAVDKHDNSIYQLDGDNLDYMICDWKSKRFVLPVPMNMSCIQTDADYEASDSPYFALVQRAVQDNTTWLKNNPGVSTRGTLNAKQLNGGGNRSAIGNTMGTLNGSPILWDVPSAFDFRTANVRVYASDMLVHTYNPLNLDAVRMLAGFKSRIWEVEIQANFRVRSVAMATSMTELKTV